MQWPHACLPHSLTYSTPVLLFSTPLEASHLNVLPHGVDDGGSCSGVYTEQSSQPVDQFVLCGFVIESEDDGSPCGDVAWATHLQCGVREVEMYVRLTVLE